MRTESTHQGPGSAHLYNDPDLSPIEFMLAVMRDTTLPLAIRLDAAAKVAPFMHRRIYPSVPYHCKVVIPPLSYEPWAGSCSPWPRSTEKHSQNPDPESKTLSHGEDTKAPVNLRGNTEPFTPDYSAAELLRSGPDYSVRPDPSVFELARKWGLPEPHLCSYCGHWLTVTYPDCICGDLSPRDPSKMN